jgi:hypothetical protein
MSVTGNREDNILSTPTKVGAVSLGHRVVMCPLPDPGLSNPATFRSITASEPLRAG